jgi:hypothetical protein
MSILDGAIRARFGQVFGSLYLDGTLTKNARVEATNGDITQTPTDYPIKCHAPKLSETYRAQNGYSDKELDIIVLQADVPVVPNTDDEVVYMGVRYTVASEAKTDGANSHWRMKCRRA